MIQAVMDTNVLVAGLRSRSGASFQMLRAIGKGRFELNISVPLVLEYEYACKDHARDLGLTHADIDEVIDYICRVSRHRLIDFLWRPILPDSLDDMVLELAVNAAADCIVTFNRKHFVGAERFRPSIVTPFEFLQRTGVL